MHWVYVSRCWQQGVTGVASVRRGQGCTMLDTNTHRVTQTSGPTCAMPMTYGDTGDLRTLESGRPTILTPPMGI